MKIQACRNALRNLLAGPAGDLSHPGLLAARYLHEQGDGHPKARRLLFTQVTEAQRDEALATLYRGAYERWKRSLPKPCHASELQADGRLIVGLGGESVLETGITLHHTYGVPIIPGSALKGLAAHYCDCVWGAADPEFKKQSGTHYRTLFGTTEDAGHIVFHDAWITPDSLKEDGLVLDVMTPHHGDYYSGKKRKRPDGGEDIVPPTDFDDPNPVTFLSVTGKFLVAVSCDVGGDEGEKAAETAMELLTEALREWGVGGKTSSGYGRLVAARQPGAPPGGKQSEPESKPTPRHRPGEKITVTRVEDPKKGRIRFIADDGVIGQFAGEDPPKVEIGATVEVWIAQASPTTYTFTLREPKRRKQKGKSR